MTNPTIGLLSIINYLYELITQRLADYFPNILIFFKCRPLRVCKYNTNCFLGSCKCLYKSNLMIFIVELH